jgi:hypothetical protein
MCSNKVPSSRTPISRMSAKMILVGRAAADMPHDCAERGGSEAARDWDGKWLYGYFFALPAFPTFQHVDGKTQRFYYRGTA